MRAVHLIGYEELDNIQLVAHLPEPKPAAGEVLLKVGASSVNQVELVLRRGYPGLQLKLPHILGGDVAGEVVAVGAGVDAGIIGARVVVYPIITCGDCERCRAGLENLCINWRFIGMHTDGGWREMMAVPAANIIQLPDNVSYEQAAAIPVAGMTAFHGLVSVAGLSRGQQFFIWGGAGGLGTFAVQIAKQLGAAVYATAGNEERMAAVRRLGADYVFNRNSQDIAAEMKHLAPDGVDVVLNYVGPAAFQTSFDMLKRGGQMLLCGIITGREMNVNLHQTYLRHLSIKGLYLGTKGELKELLNWVADGKVKPVIHKTYPLEGAAEALAELQSGAVIGKVVIRMG